MKINFNRKKLMMASLTTGCVVATVAAVASGGMTDRKASALKKEDKPVQNITEEVDNTTADINPVELKHYLSSSLYISLDYNKADNFEAGTTEIISGMAGSFSQFIENAGFEGEDDEKDATIDEVDVITKLEPEVIVSIVSGYKNLGVSDTGSTYLNVRKGPGTKYKKVGTMPSYSACEILETTDNGWYKIKSGDVEGYVSADYIATGKEANELAKDKIKTIPIVDCAVLNVRVEPNTNCNIISSVKRGEEVEIEEDLGEWLKINKNNLIGYVHSDYIKYITTLPTAIEIEEVTVSTGSSSNKNNNNSSSNKFTSKDFASGEQSVSQKTKDVIDYALQFLGNPYVYGGNSLTKGTDCSGFTKLIFAKFGYTLSRSCKAQVNDGKRISLSDVKPGDLLFYKYGNSVGHVAIYIGSGKIVHASTPKGGIKISNALYTTPAYAVRIIE